MDLVVDVARSASGRRWVWRDAEPRVAQAIAQRTGVPELVARLMAGRGIGIADAADFLDPTLRALMPDPSCMADMDRASARIADAVRRNETVAVFGDYDVDGACSAALMVRLLRGLGNEVLFHVPDRITEGYGPNGPALRALAARGASLIVCVDCGISAHAPFAELGSAADVVVLDHHKAEGPPPAVAAVVNPNRLDCGSGLTMLCAAAVAFMTAVAVSRELRRTGQFRTREEEPDLLALLDLVALATVCDVMPLTGLNRALVSQGLRVMRGRARPGIAALLEIAAVTEAPTAHSCGFGLGPRINAAGRIADCALGLRLLASEDEAEARDLALQLDSINRERQQVEATMLEAALADGRAQAEAGRAVLLVAGRGWHPGVVGIVAGRLKERFNRPACVAAITGAEARGSGRSIPGQDLGAAVIAARQAGLLSAGGGHPMAAGFTLAADRLPAFHAWLEERLAQAAAAPSAADLTIEGTLQPAGATAEMAGAVGRLAPFGPANEEPVFVLPRVRVCGADRVGEKRTTIRAFLEPEGGGARLKAVMFRAETGPVPDLLLGPRVPLHVAGHLRAETWNGQTTPSLILLDATRA